MIAMLDKVVLWVEIEGFTNFRGIQLDPEGPKFKYESSGREIIANATQHALAVDRIQAKFDEIRSAHPEWEITTASVTNSMFDWIDGDYDNDIILKSISGEPLDFDYLGWQTYEIQPDKYDSIHFYEDIRLAKTYYGKKFIPWIGWLNSYNELENNPKTYETMIKQIIICKSFQVHEVYMAPSRYFLGQPDHISYANFETTLSRLSDMNATLHQQAEPFELKITQDQRLYTDFPMWLKKINPNYFNINSNMLYDLLCEMHGGWLMWYQIVQTCGVVLIFYLTMKKKG
jgi:hypothetical protein